jgi:hypothetical protein
MLFGNPTEFAIEAYHEPSGPKWGGFGRISVYIQNACLGDIRENHCSLFHCTDQFRELIDCVETLWDASFLGRSELEIFNLIDRYSRSGECFECDVDCLHFGFITNTGEMFDGLKAFILCKPGGQILILHNNLRDEKFGYGTCSAATFQQVASSYVRWFDEQVQNFGPPYFPINPLDPFEKVPEGFDS